MDLSKLNEGQLQCVRSFGRPVMVSAGAGSGKTYTLASRIVFAFLEESGGGKPVVDHIDQVCAITYTNPGAAELKSRVKKFLRNEGLGEQALKVDNAWISTIHGMCSRILKENALALRIDPQFDILVGAPWDELWDHTVDEVLLLADGDGGEETGEEAYGEGGGNLNEKVSQLKDEFGAGATASMISLLCDQVSRVSTGWDAVSFLNAVTDPVIYAAQLQAAYLGLANALLMPELATLSEYVEPVNRALMQCSDLVDRLAVCAPEEAEEQMAQMMRSWYSPEKTRKRKLGENAMFNPLIDALRAEFHRFALGMSILQGDAFTQPLLDVAVSAHARFREAKRVRHVLDNNDLILMTLTAFREHPDVAALYENRFRLVMVDEFQDTNRLQLELIRHLCGPGLERLCTVGDIQQSIYRFQGADVDVMRGLAQEMRTDLGGVEPSLVENYRSHGDILAFVEKVFSEPEAFGGEFLRLKASRKEAKEGEANAQAIFDRCQPRRVTLLHGSTVKSVARIEDVRRAEARGIAEEFARLRGLGIRQSDMVILLRSMPNAKIYADALREAGLDCVITGGSVLGRLPEVQVISALARVLWNPNDDEALYQVLSGEMFCVPETEFLTLATKPGTEGEAPKRRALHRGFTSLMRTVSQGGETLGLPFAAHAAQALGRALANVGKAPLDALLRQVVDESGWLVRLSRSGSDGLATAANILKCIRIAADCCGDSTLSLADAAEAFVAYMAAMPKESPGALSGAGGDYVRIMTTHSSKGLEYPVVAVAEFDSFKDSRGTANPVNAKGETGYVNCLLAGESAKALFVDETSGKVRTEGSKELGNLSSLKGMLGEEGIEGDDAVARAIRMEAAAAEADAAEELRLLYVALTRAREAIVLPVRSDNGKPGTLSAHVARAFFGDAFPAEDVEFEYGGSAPGILRQLRMEPGAEDAAGEGESVPEPVVPLRYEAPAVKEPVTPEMTCTPSAYEGTFSYSGISAAAFHGAPDETVAAGPAQVPAPEPAMDEDEGDQPLRRAEDEDKATSFGSAFHLCAQFAIETGTPPTPERIRTIAAGQGVVDGPTFKDLPALFVALERWFKGSAYAFAAASPLARAEVPFFVPVGDAYLEGSIDLLCTDGPVGPGTRAILFDYKTGGHDGETPQQRYYKHLLQAQCYAYALLSQGCETVDAHFVRVQRAPQKGLAPYEGAYAAPPTFTDADTIDYRFTADVLPALRTVIADTYERHLLLANPMKKP